MGKRWISTPAALVVVWLAISAVPAFEWTRAVMAWFGFVYLPLLWVSLVAIRVRSEHEDATYLALCAQAPIGLIPAWFRNDEALLGWLEALANEPAAETIVGGVALLVCAFLPVALAWRAYVHGASRRMRIGFLVPYALAWVAGIMTFDGYMFFGGLLSFCGLLWFSTGALIRVIVLCAMIGFALRKNAE